ncbi:MAG: polyphosphate kinase 1 [Myxococcaceae bacterium]
MDAPVRRPPPTVESNDPRMFINRELSALAFNLRILGEAQDATLPPYERVRFLSIASANLDEFFMVRVAGIKQQLASGVTVTEADGLSPTEQFQAITAEVREMVRLFDTVWRDELVPLLRSHGVELLAPDALDRAQRDAVHEHFRSAVFPALTPLAVDPGHPFPHLRNKSLNLAVVLQRDGRKRRAGAGPGGLAVVQVPTVLSRLVPVPAGEGRSAYLLLEDLIGLFLAELFPGFAVEHKAAFRVTRNWDLNVDEEESEDLMSTIQEELRRRDRGMAVRLELNQSATLALEASLRQSLGLTHEDVYRSEAPLQLSDLTALSERDHRPELRAEPFTPALPPPLRDTESLFPVLARGDVLLQHPYDSFDPVTRLIEEAADDPNVLAIKQTLYRIAPDSPIARALSRAAENGKQVAALVELKARLDEANNIAWARRMEETGVHVVYGLIGLKTHCKITLVVRREGQGIRRYVHLGTGNYNALTARQYTDLSLFTARTAVADDVSALFNMLTGYAVPPTFKRLVVAPFGLKEKLTELVRREADRARRGEGARILCKVNHLVDADLIRELYQASQAGVRIDLLIRGICCLRPGLLGVSENIRVRAITDRFLEHGRVFAFGTPERAEVFLSSSDWMPRNFVRRVEVMVPVEDPVIRLRLLDEVLGLGLRDDTKATELQPDGTYSPVRTEGGPTVRSQMVFLERAHRGEPGKEAVIRHIAAPEPTPPPRSAVPQA